MSARHARWLARLEESKEYQTYRSKLQSKWRPHILKRDRSRCRNCGKTGDLHVAHITDAIAFVKAARQVRAVTFSYRWDNLYLLCVSCHKISHRDYGGLSPLELEVRKQVESLESQLRRLRGWSTAFSALPPGLLPAGTVVNSPFHDRMRITPLTPFPTFGEFAVDGGKWDESPEVIVSQKTLP